MSDNKSSGATQDLSSPPRSDAHDDNEGDAGVDAQIGHMLTVLVDYKNGRFDRRLPSTWTGVMGKMADTMNDILTMSERRADEIDRVCHVVGKEGKLKQWLSVPGVAGGWADEITSLNMLIEDLVSPTTEVTRAVGAVARRAARVAWLATIARTSLRSTGSCARKFCAAWALLSIDDSG